MAQTLPPVGKVMNWLEAAGFSVSYLFEDLVFVEGNAFLIHFDKSEPPEIQILTNSECNSEKAAVLEDLLLTEARNHEIKPVSAGRFTLSQKNDEEIDIRFKD